MDSKSLIPSNWNIKYVYPYILEVTFNTDVKDVIKNIESYIILDILEKVYPEIISKIRNFNNINDIELLLFNISLIDGYRKCIFIKINTLDNIIEIEIETNNCVVNKKYEFKNNICDIIKIVRDVNSRILRSHLICSNIKYLNQYLYVRCIYKDEYLQQNESSYEYVHTDTFIGTLKMPRDMSKFCKIDDVNFYDIDNRFYQTINYDDNGRAQYVKTYLNKYDEDCILKPGDIAYKAGKHNKNNVIIKLKLLPDTEIVTLIDLYKSRISHAKVIKIFNCNNKKFKYAKSFVHSQKSIVYKKHETVYADALDKDVNNENSNGIGCHKNIYDCLQWFSVTVKNRFINKLNILKKYRD